MTALLLAAAAVGFASPAAAQDLPSLLAGMETAYAQVSGYTARFVRQEMIDGRLRPREEAILKYQRPGRIYLRWIAGPAKGREILFVDGRDDDRILVHQPGIVSGLFTATMAPDSERVLRESRHPVTDVGIGRLIDLIVGNARRALGRAELAIEDGGVVEALGRRERRLELRLPPDAGRGYYCYRALISVDLEWSLPVAATIFDWSGRVVEDYAYRDLRLNAELTALDFDPANPEYRFPRWRLRL